MAKPKGNSRLVGMVRLFVVLLATVVVSCSGEGVLQPQAPSTDEAGLSEWSIRIFVGDGEKRQRVDLPPVPQLSFGSPSDSKLNAFLKGPSPKSLKELIDQRPEIGEEPPPKAAELQPGANSKAVIGGPGGTTNVEQDLSVRSGWALVFGAAFECGFSRPGSDTFITPDDPVVPPWSRPGAVRGWSIFPRPRTSVRPTSCSESLQYSETLVCIANELSKVADAVAPIRWEGVAYANATLPGVPAGPWTIPPQMMKDRFIARDLAIYMLATVALNDTFRINDLDPSVESCAEGFARAADDSTFGVAQATQLFGASPNATAKYFPPLEPSERVVNTTNMVALATSRLRFQTQVLRSASRLLDQLIDDSVAADLAGTAQRRARATDPIRGAEVAWGDRNNQNGRYNTLAHAIRVIAGRWELSTAAWPDLPWFTRDPQCGTVAAGDLLAKAYGEDRDARVENVAVRTNGQKLATEVVQKAGILIPPDQLQSPKAVRDAVRWQLVGKEAEANGLSPTDPLVGALGIDRSVGYVLDDLSEADLNFALTHSFSQYRVLNTRPVTTSVQVPGGGLVVDTFVAPQLAQVQGVALLGGMPLGDMTVDVMSRVAGIQSASQCDELGGLIGEVTAGLSARGAFQDSYSVGQTLQRRLVVLRESIRAAQNMPSSHREPLLDQTEKASAEARAWSGPGRIAGAGLARADDPTKVGGVWLATLGFEPENFSVATAEDVSEEIMLVYGEPWVADCAARLRENCPPDLSDYIVAPSTSSVTVMTPEMRKTTGYDGTLGLFEFQLPPTVVPDFFPTATNSELPHKHVYVVQRQDPTSPSTRGKVLGALAMRNPLVVGDFLVGGTGTPVSRKQAAHYRSILGLSQKQNGTSRGAPESLSEGSSYCIPGVPKDLFVPLENELTSDSDEYENSWRHYLELAKQAAERADALGKELIDLGLQREFRREAAGEELAQVCGDYAALDKLEVKDGKVGLARPKTDGALSDCLSEEKIDIVFLTTKPVEAVANENAFLQTRLNCGSADASPLCERLAAWAQQCTGSSPPDTCEELQVKARWLGLSEYANEATSSAATACANVNQAATTLANGFAGTELASHASQSWLSPEALAFLMNRVRLVTATDSGQFYWQLLVNTQPRMSSHDPALWPGCTRPGHNCSNVPLASEYDRLFRMTTGQPTPLGASLDGQGNPEQESNGILWRVQGALWLAAAMSGKIPEGLFDIAMTAADLNILDEAPVYSVFGSGRFTSFPAQQIYRLSSENHDDDIQIIGDALPLPSPTALAIHEGIGVPAWLRYPSGQTLFYRHVRARNAEIDGFGSQELSNWVASQLTAFNGIQCKENGALVPLHGPANGTTSAATTATNEITKLRRGSNWGKLCRAPGGAVTLSVDGDATTVKGGVVDLVRTRYGFAGSSGLSTCGNGLSTLSQLPKLLKDYPNRLGDSGLSSQMQPYFMSLGSTSTGSPSISTCVHEHDPDGTQVIESGCASDEQVLSTLEPGPGFQSCSYLHSAYRFTRRTLSPSACPPADRVSAYVNSYPPLGPCAAASQLAQVMLLACNMRPGGSFGDLAERPDLTKVEDLDAFVSWVDTIARQTRQQVGRIYLEQLPARIVDDFEAAKVGGGSFKGSHGLHLLELRKALESLSSGWNRASGNLDQLRDAIDGARNGIQGAKLTAGSALANLALQRMSIHASMIQSAAGLLSVTSGNFGAVASASAGIAFGEAMLTKTKDLEFYATSQEGNQIEATLNQLALSSGPVYTDLKNALNDIRTSSVTVLGIVELIRQSEEKAQYEAAKASGADYVEIDGQIVKFPVNTVQRRMYDVTESRYKTALKDAKYLAYVARLAIEQRVGLRLNTIATDVGPLEQPAYWADDVCSLTGIDYKSLSEFEVDGGPPADDGEAELIAELSKQFIGDYVRKLENFVEYYNIQYPSHDGDDTTVLSLRDNLLGPAKACIIEAPNLLYHSSNLAGASFVDTDEGTLRRGWEVMSCGSTDSFCLSVSEGAAVINPPQLPETGPGGGFSWVRDMDAVQGPSGGDGGIVDGGADADPGDAGTYSPEVPRATVQVVELNAGESYVLSWWDQARGADGDLLAAGEVPVAYQVVVTSPGGGQVAYFSDEPFVPAATGNAWSERRSLGFTAAAAGAYRVAVSPAAFPVDRGSLLVANMQLERTPSTALPGPYYDVKSSRLVPSSQCSSLSGADVQAAFRYSCTPTKECFYELAAPIVLDTGSLGKGDSRLQGLLAAGNFNFRHITVAANIVGTGVYDCSSTPSQSCFAKAVVEYTLDHDAFQVGVLGWNLNEVQTFNFGSAGINRAKALAAERYITTPIGSADLGLLSQPGVEKSEYRGRPIDGAYRLKIWDTPQLRWDRVEDIQFVLRYRYWSPIAPQAPGG